MFCVEVRTNISICFLFSSKQEDESAQKNEVVKTEDVKKGKASLLGAKAPMVYVNTICLQKSIPICERRTSVFIINC